MADKMYPALKLFKPLVLRIAWDSRSKMAALRSPALFVSGRRDATVPPGHMDALFAACGAAEKRLVPVGEGTHEDTVFVGGEAVFREMRDFFRIKWWENDFLFFARF